MEAELTPLAPAELAQLDQCEAAIREGRKMLMEEEFQEIVRQVSSGEWEENHGR